MKKSFKGIAAVLLLIIIMLSVAIPVLAAGADNDQPIVAEGVEAVTVEATEGSVLGAKAYGAAIAIGIAAAGGAVGMGLAVAKAVDGLARQPEAESKIRTMLMLGLVFIETAIIYALVIAILIIFVL